MIQPQPISTLFPYTTLFRSGRSGAAELEREHADGHDVRPRSFRDADRKSTRLNSSHITISYAVFCLKKKTSIDIMSMQDAYVIVYTDLLRDYFMQLYYDVVS